VLGLKVNVVFFSGTKSEMDKSPKKAINGVGRVALCTPCLRGKKTAEVQSPLRITENSTDEHNNKRCTGREESTTPRRKEHRLQKRV